MESIRPDADELRAGPKVDDVTAKDVPARKRRPSTPEQSRSPVSGGNGGGGGSDSRGGRSSAGRGFAGLLLLLVLTLAVGGGWFGWQLNSKVAELEGQLEEADYWVRQSKLALARFEGDLSETGESLEQRGSSIEDQLDQLQGDLKTTNDEIRKLWVLSNERNRPRIESLTKDLETVTGTAVELSEQLAAVESAQTETARAVSVQGQALGQRVDSLDAQVEARSQKLSAVEGQLEALEQSLAQAAEMAEVATNLAREVAKSAEQTVDSRLQRFTREQKLASDGLDGRISALESGGSKLEPLERQLGETRRRLAEAEQTLKAVDASRAQLTSRLVRLQEQVDRLSSQ